MGGGPGSREHQLSSTGPIFLDILKVWISSLFSSSSSASMLPVRVVGVVSLKLQTSLAAMAACTHVPQRHRTRSLSHSHSHAHTHSHSLTQSLLPWSELLSLVPQRDERE